MLVTLLKTFLMPPALQLLLMLLAFLLWSRHIFWSRLLMFLAWGSLVALSMPIVSAQLYVWLEAPYQNTAAVQRRMLDESSDKKLGEKPQAIVVLGGGRILDAPEYGGKDQVSESALWRLRYGAVLAKQYNLPVITSGGTVYPYDILPEAKMAADVLQNEWGVPEVWQEGSSRDTWKNAQNTAALLRQRQQGQQSKPSTEQQDTPTVILVTHAYHMRRAEYAFQQAGVSVIPMPTAYRANDVSAWIDAWLPQSFYLHRSRVALHEYLGLLFYRFRQSSK